jgi:hypothetical protein
MRTKRVEDEAVRKSALIREQRENKSIVGVVNLRNDSDQMNFRLNNLVGANNQKTRTR